MLRLSPFGGVIVFATIDTRYIQPSELYVSVRDAKLALLETCWGHCAWLEMPSTEGTIGTLPLDKRTATVVFVVDVVVVISIIIIIILFYRSCYKTFAIRRCTALVPIVKYMTKEPKIQTTSSKSATPYLRV